MNLDTADVDLEGEKTMKVTIPKRLHLKLHSLKILTGTTISQTVEDAVLAFLEDRGELPDTGLV